MIAIRLPKTSNLESPGAGMLGWAAIHVHANIVDRQLHNIPYIDRESNLLSSRMKMGCRWFAGKSCGGCGFAGRARVFQDTEKKERYNRMRMIIF